jgi:hypothetical protein
LTTLPTTSKTDPREDKLIELLGEGLTLKEAGRQAGYSEQYCRSSIIRKWESDHFVSRLLKHHRAKALELLPKSNIADHHKFDTATEAVDSIQSALKTTKDHEERLNIIRKGMAILSKLDATQERIAKNSGLLKEQHQSTQVIVPIKDMQVILNQTIQSGSQPEAIDVTPEQGSSNG